MCERLAAERGEPGAELDAPLLNALLADVGFDGGELRVGGRASQTSCDSGLYTQTAEYSEGTRPFSVLLYSDSRTVDMKTGDPMH